MPLQQYWFYHSYTTQEGAEGLLIFLGWQQQQVVLEYTRPQSYNKKPVRIFDLGEWWDLLLHGTAVSMRRVGRQPGTHTTICFLIQVYNLKKYINYLKKKSHLFRTENRVDTYFPNSLLTWVKHELFNSFSQETDTGNQLLTFTV